MFYVPVAEGDHGYRLVKRPDTPYYQVTWYCPSRRKLQRRSTKTTDREQAERVMRAYANRSHSSEPKPPSETLVEDLLERYMVRKQGVDPRACAERTAYVQLVDFCNRHGIKTVDQLGHSSQELFVEERRAALMSRLGKASNATINRDLEVL